MTDIRSTPLRDRHEALGATFTDFGGWSMPVRYTSELVEHRAVREAAGLFDVSHMAVFLVTGSLATPLLDQAVAGRFSDMAVGRAKYSLVLAEDGGIVDDVIVYRLDESRFLVIANAANREAVGRALAQRREALPRPRIPDADGSFAFVPGIDVRVEDASDASALLAVQGPRAVDVLAATGALALVETPARIGDSETPWTLDDLGYYRARGARFEDAPVLVARTGYTGEDGFELLVHSDRAGALWDALLAAGAPFGLVPAGLAARDTLRLEAGMPLYGHELTRAVRPAQAGLARVVATDKETFVGKDAISAASTDAPVLVGLVSDGRRAGRAGYDVLDAAGTPVGTVTSGALSPTLGHPIAMAYVSPASSAVGTPLAIDVRGTRIPATVTRLPFYRRNR